MSDEIKKNDQISLLKAAAVHTDTGKFPPLFTYPNCGHHLVQCGLATEDAKITIAGRAALFLLGMGEDPTDGGSSVTMKFSLRNVQESHET